MNELLTPTRRSGYAMWRRAAWALWRKWRGRYIPPDVFWARIVMNEQTRRWVQSLDPSGLDVLEISGKEWDRPGLFRSYRSVGFPEYDVCAGPMDERFDLIIAEQVWEHLRHPVEAGRHVRQMLRPGGTFLLTLPFMIKVHPQPIDAWRWTCEGVKYLLEESGFDPETIQVDAWGNRACVRANLSKWAIYLPWVHSLKNEPEFPLVIWAMARVG